MKISKRLELKIDVVTAARQRIKNIFENDCEIIFSTSGGKDSICVNDLLFKMASAGEIDKSKLRILFVDEEAIYPCVEKIVLNMRKQWLTLGVPFDWYALEFKHFNCLNYLTQDESFICFDRHKKEVWIRKPPPFAIRSDARLRVVRDTYQDFFLRVNRGKIQITGVRAAESIQRARSIADGSLGNTGMAAPLYDWKDKDVWKYISDNGLTIPDAYLFMFQCGIAKNRMRISQFFSIDTAGSLVKMGEFYHELFDKICAREPNANLALLYYDTELFRRAKNVKDKTDYKQKTLELLKHPEKINYSGAVKIIRGVKILYTQYGAHWTRKEWKAAYQILTAGDPKARSLRALRSNSVIQRNKANGRD